MKIPPPKSILSPGRAKDHHHLSSSSSSSSQISLSTSLSRRLRTNGSLKGGQASPMFPPGSSSAGGKRKGSAFESPEPSSPKVTCIGQVRVKGKKHGRKKMGVEDEASGKAKDGNVKWVLKDFSCFLPCRSGFCVTAGKDGDGNSDARSGDCCMFARWVVDDGRKIELVVGDEGQEVEEDEAPRSYRRNLFQEIEFKDAAALAGDAARVSICIPPKNALLLMRCRSDPVKMAALANKFFEAPPPEEDDETGRAMDEDHQPKVGDGEESNNVSSDAVVDAGEADAKQTPCLIVELEPSRKSISAVILEQVIEEEEDEDEDEGEECIEVHQEDESHEQRPPDSILECDTSPPEQDPAPGNSEAIVRAAPPPLPDCLLLMMCEPKLSMEVSKETWVCSTDFIRWVPGGRPRKKTENGDGSDKRTRVNPIQEMPDEATSASGPVPIPDEDSKNKVRGKSKTAWKFQPPRSSCHYPSQQRSKGESMAAAIEKKLVCSRGYEPYSLTRCKSEPMRSAAAKLVPQE